MLYCLYSIFLADDSSVVMKLVLKICHHFAHSLSPVIPLLQKGVIEDLASFAIYPLVQSPCLVGIMDARFWSACDLSHVMLFWVKQPITRPQYCHWLASTSEKILTTKWKNGGLLQWEGGKEACESAKWRCLFKWHALYREPVKITHICYLHVFLFALLKKVL